jgi:hypothetical protein
MNIRWIRALYVVAGVYEAALGVVFLVAATRVFAWFGVEAPNHVAYVQFPALLLLVFAALFFRVATDPVRFRDLMPYGVGLKAAYCATVFGHALATGIPSMWMPWAWADLAFLVLFVAAWRRTAAVSA